MDNKLFFPMYNRLHLIPYWVAAAARRKGLKLSDLLDYSKAAEVLSQNDIMSLQAAHQLDGELMQLGGPDRIFSQWWFGDNTTEAKRSAENEVLGKLALNPDFFKDLRARLYSEESTSSTDVAISKDDPVCGFEVVALRDQALGVVLYNSITKVKDMQDLRYRLLHDIVRQLYVYEPSKTASSFVYSMYLKTLLRRNPLAA